jgi:hypothetical protein
VSGLHVPAIYVTRGDFCYRILEKFCTHQYDGNQGTEIRLTGPSGKTVKIVSKFEKNSDRDVQNAFYNGRHIE